MSAARLGRHGRALFVAGALLTGCASRTVLRTPPAGAPPAEVVETTLFLIGDAGAPDPRGEPVLSALAAQLARAAGERVVVFLGDNVYDRGVPDSAAPGRAEAERRLQAQVAATAGARAIFLAGNHDWNRGAADGWHRVRNQERLLGRLAPAARWLPPDGCPGPAVADFGAHLRLVALDTQWWLHEGPRAGPADTACAAATPAAVTAAVRAALGGAGTRHVVVAGHHPLASGGRHGGHFSLGDHLFPLRAWRSWLWLPLPLIGSAYPLARMAGISPQDLASGRYEQMRDSFAVAFAVRPPLVYAGGHDHTLQVIDGGPARHLLVSGGGYFGHVSRVVALAQSRFAAARSGFLRIEFLHDARARLAVITVAASAATEEVFTMWLDTGESE